MLLVCSFSTENYYQYFQTEVFVEGTHSACKKIIITALFSWSEAQGGAEGNTLFLSVLIKDSWSTEYITYWLSVQSLPQTLVICFCSDYVFISKLPARPCMLGTKLSFLSPHKYFLFQVVCWWTQDILYFTVKTIVSGGGLLRKTSHYITQQRPQI